MIRKALLRIARWIYQYYGATEICHDDVIEYLGEQYKIYCITQTYGGQNRIEIVGTSKYSRR